MQPTTNPFGTIDRVGPAVGASSPQAGFSALLVTGINIFLIIGGISALVFLLWGALDWVTSGGEEEKLQKARQKITNAIIGSILMLAALTIWTLVTGSILGIVDIADRGIIFDIPRVGCLPEGAACNPNQDSQCCSGTCDDTDSTCSPP